MHSTSGNNPTLTSKIPERFSRSLAWLWLWLVLVLALASFSTWQWLQAPRLNTDMMALLPNANHDPYVAKASQTFSTYWTQQVAFLVGAPSAETSAAEALALSLSLKNSALFEDVIAKQDPQFQQQWFEFYYPHRFQLLAEKHQQALDDNEPDVLWQDFQRQLYSSTSSNLSQQIQQDPLLLFPQWALSLSSNPGQNFNGVIQFQHDNQFYSLVRAQLKESPFALSYQQAFKSLLQEINTHFTSHSDRSVIHTGVIFHAINGAEQAQQEVSLFGLVSLVGILVLVYFAFFSFLPLVLSLLAISTGIIIGGSVCLLIFGEVHLFSLVFGASLIGVAIDYAFHYFADCSQHTQHQLPRIFPGITLGLISSVIGYTSLAMTGFPGLKQIAVLSASGLIGAWLCVCLWFPHLPQISPSPRKQRYSWVMLWSQAFLAFWHKVFLKEGTLSFKKPTLLVGVALIGWSIYTLSHLTFNDDISVLQSISPTLKAQDQQFASITGGQRSTQYLLVSGETPQQVLEREERLTLALNTLIKSGALQNFQAISQTLPSVKEQTLNQQRLQHAFSATGSLRQRLQNLGLEDDTLSTYQQQLESSLTTLSLNQWLDSPMGQEQGFLWLGKTHENTLKNQEKSSSTSTSDSSSSKTQYFSAVLLEGIDSPAQFSHDIRKASLEGVHLIDTAQSLSLIFQEYRQLAIHLILLAYLMIVVMLFFRLRHRGVLTYLKVLCPPLLAAIFALSIVSTISPALNIFHVFSLIMVVAIGIDYAVFFAEYSGEQQTTMMAVTLSAVTTLLAFGMLAFSHTAAISAFGLTMAIGIAVAYVLSPLAYQRHDSND